MDRKADINNQDNDGNIPLHRAASMGHVEIVNLLLKYKADVTIRTKAELTALH